MASAQQIEEFALNAWPGLQTVFIDGWVARLSQGYSKRANSVVPLYPGQGELDDKIRYCEHLYQQAGIGLIFRLPSFAAANHALDARLDSRGFPVLDETCVQQVDLSQIRPVWSPQAVLAPDDEADDWIHGYHALSGSPPHPAHRQIVSLISGQRCFLSIVHEGAVAARGLGVLSHRVLGLFDIVTDPAQRRLGFGRALTESLLAWGRDQGATHAYLQVVAANTAARRLYTQLGFQDLYRYWYRVAPVPPA